MIEIIRTVRDMHGAADHMRRQGLRIGMVPTMGYLHEGHLSLVQQALQATDRVVVSIFVNPIQFGPKEDLSAYPRDLDRDLNMIGELGAHIAYVPDVAEMYPEGYATYIDVAGLTDHLCGASRPGHFRGVATVVAKLFAAAKPHVAVFGQKDAQQVAVIRRMVRDLNLDVEILVSPTVREADGLAKSSRNVYLTPHERQEAPVLYRALQKGRALIEQGERRPEAVIAAMQAVIADAPHAQIDYVEIVHPERIQPVQTLFGEVLLALAVRFGKTRLIDNTIVRATG